MNTDLTVSSGTILTLDDNPPEHLKNNFERIQITALEDLVTTGFVQSEDTLNHLLDSAKAVTTHALSLRNEPLPRIPGTSRIDLRRFDKFTLLTSDAASHEQNIFWKLFREIPPLSSKNIDSKTKLEGIINVNLPIVNLYRFQNVTVEPNAVLEFKKEINTLLCKDLLVRKTGRIVIQRGSLHINAFSIQGEQ